MVRHTQFVGQLPTNSLNVFDHFLRSALKGLRIKILIRVQVCQSISNNHDPYNGKALKQGNNKFCQPMLFIQTNAANVKWFLLIPVRKNILLWIGRKDRGKKLYLLKCCILLIFLYLCWDPLLKKKKKIAQLQERTCKK